MSALALQWPAAMLALVLTVERPSVVVFPDPQTALADPDDEASIRGRGFEAVPSETLLAAVEADAVAAKDRDRASLNAVAAQLEAVDELYLEQSWDPMLQQLEAIERRALPVLARPSGCDMLWQVELRFALALGARAASGDDDAAAARLKLAAALRPGKAPTPGMYGPAFSEAYASAKTLLDAAVHTSVALNVEPADAMMWVDCERVTGGEASLAAGLHVVAGGVPGFEDGAVVVDTTTRPAAALTLSPAAQPSLGAWRAFIDPKAGPSWREAVLREANQAGAHAVVWLTGGDDFVAQLLLPSATGRTHRADGRRRAIEAALAELGDDGELVVSPRLAAPAADPDRPADTSVEPKKRPIARTWWFWTIIGGVAVAALGVGLGLGLRPQERDRLRINVR